VDFLHQSGPRVVPKKDRWRVAGRLRRDFPEIVIQWDSHAASAQAKRREKKPLN